MNTKAWAAALAVLTLGTGAQAAGFVNGGFDNGTTSGWTITGGSRSSILNNNLDPSDITGSDSGRSSIIAAGAVDPNIGAAFGSLVYSGGFSFRAQDTVFGGFATVISQSVTNYTDPDIFFVWKAALEGAHGTLDAATMIITLRDDTTNTTLITRQYNAASGGGGVDPRFSFNGDFFYTPAWQLEQLTIGAALSGHDFTLTVLAADCQPTGHAGYVYLDGFGAVAPPQGDLPEPGSIALVGAALLGLAATRRRKQA